MHFYCDTFSVISFSAFSFAMEFLSPLSLFPTESFALPLARCNFCNFIRFFFVFVAFIAFPCAFKEPDDRPEI